MNGTIGNGNYRTAGDAYDNMVHNNLMINPSNAAITLCPATKGININGSYISGLEEEVTQSGNGFYEVDTYLDVTGISVSEALTFEKTGYVTVTDVNWAGDVNGTNKINFQWTGTGDFEIEFTSTLTH